MLVAPNRFQPKLDFSGNQRWKGLGARDDVAWAAGGGSPCKLRVRSSARFKLA
jgi:hypothetical protein